MKYLNYVNTKVGTYNEPRYSNGNIYPIVSRPFGMVNFSIQTKGDNNWFYNPLARSFEGIRLTHQPSPWVGDYGHILILPFTGKFHDNQYMRWSSYRPSETVLRPDVMSVYLQRYRVRAELTPTERGACFNFKGVKGENVGVAFTTFGASGFTVEGNVVKGYTESSSIWWEESSMREYFYIEFSEPVVEYKQLENGGVALYFACPQVQMKMACGYVSEKQTELNFKRELLGKSFDEIREKTGEIWEENLGSIEVSDENQERKEMFYSCFYRALLYPRVFHEFDENNKPVHFNIDTKTCEKGVFYTDNGFWDTYRTVYPLLSIIRPELVREMVEGFVNYSEETGWLPKWLSPGEIGIMPGTLVEATIADACVKGIITGELRTRAYKALKKSAYQTGEGRHGRQGIADYIKYGYMPMDHKESVNHTCDCAYGDFCIATVAGLEGDVETAKALMERSKSWTNLFDAKTGFLRSRDREGNMRATFNPYDWGGDNCEGSSWQNSFAVYHDIVGLANLYGGKEKLEARLDELFSAEPIFNVGAYGQEIHEMSEMACVDFGQMAISNQPSFHLPWVYVLLGRRDKAKKYVENLVNNAFLCDIEGFPGDDDNGTTSAWYMFSCMGFYPICPGNAEFVCTAPLFNCVKINGKVVKKNMPDVVRFDEIFE